MPSLFEIGVLAALGGIVYHLAQIGKKLEQSPTQPPGETGTFQGEFMYVVKADNPDVGFQLNYSVTDSEGNEVPREETIALVESTDENVVSIDAESGRVHFGAPGVASVNARVYDKDFVEGDDPLGSFGAQFTVVAGEPAAVSGGSITFEGLEEVPDNEPTEGGGETGEGTPTGELPAGPTDGGETPTDEGNI